MDTKTSSTLFNTILTIVLGVLYLLSLAYLNLGNLLGDAPIWEMLVNILLLSVPLVLLYGSIGLLIVAVRKHRRCEPLGTRLSGLLYWTPRVAGILITLFVSVFALDVFGENQGFWQTLIALFMHLVPSFVLLAIVIISWRWERLGFWIFLLAAFLFSLTVPRGGVGNLLLFAAPLLLIALLYWVNWHWRNEIHPTASLVTS